MKERGRTQLGPCAGSDWGRLWSGARPGYMVGCARAQARRAAARGLFCMSMGKGGGPSRRADTHTYAPRAREKGPGFPRHPGESRGRLRDVRGSTECHASAAPSSALSGLRLAAAARPPSRARPHRLPTRPRPLVLPLATTTGMHRGPSAGTRRSTSRENTSHALLPGPRPVGGGSAWRFGTEGERPPRPPQCHR